MTCASGESGRSLPRARRYHHASTKGGDATRSGLVIASRPDVRCTWFWFRSEVPLRPNLS
jgi:hypothetical protein